MNDSKKIKIVVAPDSFKGCLTSPQAADAIRRGLQNVSHNFNIVCLPIADGGEGTVDILTKACRGRVKYCNTTNPINQYVQAPIGFINNGKTCIIEMASAAGLPLIPPGKRNPMKTSSYGFGKLLAETLTYNPKKIIIGIGGSGTVDGGIGMAQALGYIFIDKSGKRIKSGAGGGSLIEIRKIIVDDVNPALSDTEICVVTDVRNPIAGKNNGIKVFSPQKGATPEQVKLLEKYIKHFAEIIERDVTGPGAKLKTLEGGGAAGGVGMGLYAFCKAALFSGAEYILNTMKFREEIKDAKLIITGEGKSDEQTLMGKGPGVVAEYGRKYGIPVILLSGNIKECSSPCRLEHYGIAGTFSICDSPMSLEEAMMRAEELIQKSAENIGIMFNHLRNQ